MRRLTGMLKACRDTLLTPAEDPRGGVLDIYARQQALLLEVRRASSQIGATKRQLEGNAAAMRSKLPVLEEEARRALIAGRDDLARLALQRRHVVAEELLTLEGQIVEIQREEQHLALVESRVSAQITALSVRRDVIAARYSAAEAQARIGEALGGVSDELADLGVALERAEERATYLRARAAAIDELTESGLLDRLGGPSMTREFTDQTASERAVADQMAALKRRLGEDGLLPPVGPTLGTGTR
ncbi:MAG: PspA/IM30 family protein [Actinomycetota bacterium]|nr:PspA/IM30 family protein [Actinomycetota bacterium]